MLRQQRFEETVRSVARQCITAEQAANSRFDVTVIGAGPAGTLAARQLAQRGMSVLLVEKSVFPRHKVCGCCISATAIQMLDFAGLDGLLQDFGAVPVRELQIASGAMRTGLPLGHSRSLSRKAFDLALVAAALDAGVAFLPACTARVGQVDELGAAVVLTDSSVVEPEMAHPPKTFSVTAKLVLVADGLGGTSLQSHSQFSVQVRSSSRFGTGSVSHLAPESFAPGTIFMACGEGGYLGLVRLEDGTTDLAAAFDAAFVREAGSPAIAASRVLQDCDWPVPADIGDIHWQGTVPLTRRRQAVAATRLYVLGDAASYVEPFTGEGIGWALSSALSVVPLATRAVRCWDQSLIWWWEHTYAHLIRRRQQSTRVIAEVLRHHRLVSFAGNLLNTMPSAAATLSRQIGHSWNSEDLEWLRS